MNFRGFALLFLIIVTLMSVNVLAVQPYGANYTEESSERSPIDPAEDHEALAGNVTELSVTGFSTTQTWQGYFGNVSGTIQLADSNDNVMYNWTLAHPEGEIYASRNDSLEWNTIMCFNYTATGTYASDVAQAGGTSLYGMNLTIIEAEYNITFNDMDGVNETFTLLGDHEAGESFTHNLFHTNNLQFDAGECLSTHVFGSSGSAEDDNFQEVLLYDSTSQAVVFTALLDEEDLAGFDNAYHDFEMLVLEDGHGTDTDTTTYYFYVELE